MHGLQFRSRKNLNTSREEISKVETKVVSLSLYLERGDWSREEQLEKEKLFEFEATTRLFEFALASGKMHGPQRHPTTTPDHDHRSPSRSCSGGPERNTLS